MPDIWTQIIGIFQESFGKAVREARTPAGLRRRAGRFERRALRVKSKKLKERYTKIAEQLWKQAARMEIESQ